VYYGATADEIRSEKTGSGCVETPADKLVNRTRVSSGPLAESSGSPSCSHTSPRRRRRRVNMQIERDTRDARRIHQPPSLTRDLIDDVSRRHDNRAPASPAASGTDNTHAGLLHLETMCVCVCVCVCVRTCVCSARALQSSPSDFPSPVRNPTVCSFH